jgi:hypothetical protein
MESSVCDKACEILEKTEDGDKLSPAHLYLLQEAVNGNVTELGRQAFENLHSQVIAGTYQPPWFHGVEHMTQDHEGYVYWKGKHVEHYHGSVCHSEEGKRELEELARRCRILESEGAEINVQSAVWNWEDR